MQIKIENEAYNLTIYEWGSLNRVRFYMDAKEGPVTTHAVYLPKNTDLSDWLLTLAKKGEAKDRDGRLVLLYSTGGASQGDTVEFDWWGDDHSPNLPLAYYGFTAAQLRKAILDKLEPEPEVPVTEEERAIFEAGKSSWHVCYPSSLRNVVQRIQLGERDDLIRKAKAGVK